MATEAQETTDLIGSDKVEGTTVYDATGEKMGSVARVMIARSVAGGPGVFVWVAPTRASPGE